jgi:hypothetical protein
MLDTPGMPLFRVTNCTPLPEFVPFSTGLVCSMDTFTNAYREFEGGGNSIFTLFRRGESSSSVILLELSENNESIAFQETSSL